MDLELPNEPFSPRANRSGASRSKASRYLLAGGLLAGGVTIGAIFSPIGLAGADSGDAAVSDDTATVDDDTVGDAETAEGRGRHGHHRHGRGLGLGGSLDSLSETLGLDLDALRSELADGSSLADIAEAQGVDIEALTDDLLAGMKAHLDEAVTEGRIDQAEADERLSEADERIDDLINGELPLRGERGPGGHRGLGLSELSDELGIDAEDVMAGLKDGKSLVEIAADAGVGEQELVDALIAHMTERLDAAAADGKLDADRVEELKAGLSDRVNEMVNRSPGDGPLGFGDGVRDGRRGLGRHGHWTDEGSTDDGSSDGETQESSFTF